MCERAKKTSEGPLLSLVVVSTSFGCHSRLEQAHLGVRVSGESERSDDANSGRLGSRRRPRENARAGVHYSLDCHSTAIADPAAPSRQVGARPHRSQLANSLSHAQDARPACRAARARLCTDVEQLQRARSRQGHGGGRRRTGRTRAPAHRRRARGGRQARPDARARGKGRRVGAGPAGVDGAARRSL